MGTGTETIIEIKMEGRKSLGTSEVMVEVGWKTRERGRRQRVTRSHSRMTQRPSEIVASYKGPEPRDGR